MAEEKVYGFYDNFCKAEVLSESKGAYLNNELKKLNDYETGTVETTIGKVKYVKRGYIVTYYVQFVTSSTDNGTSGIANVPYYNPDQQFFGGAIMRVATTPVNFACLCINENGRLNCIHGAYDSQVEFVGTVTVILKD